jgi:hypothetical protein
MKRLLITLAVLSAAVTAPSAMPAPPPLAAHQDGVVGPLLVPGDRVEIRYVVETPGVKAPIGTLYVRNDLQKSFTSVALTAKRYHRATVHAVVPAGLIRGRKLLYYAVVKDPATGRSVTVPAGGAATPQSAFVLEKPVIVRLGTHRFGHTRKPEAVVARARPDQVGWLHEGVNSGPETFLVDRHRSIWLHDEVNHRLLVWRPGRPGTVARTVTLPFLNGEDVALGPAGTVYFTRGLPNPPRMLLYRMSVATGKLLWQIRLAGDVGGNTQLRVGPDGTLYALAADLGWEPVATPDGRPLSMAAQRRGAGYQPLPGGLRLLSETYQPDEHQAPREVRCALVDRGGRIVRAWRVVSRTNINLDDLFSTPALVGGDLVVVLQPSAGTPPDFKWEYEVLRLGASGLRARFSLPIAAYGEHLFAEIRVGPDGKLYQLASSPTTGVRVNRYSLR